MIVYVKRPKSKRTKRNPWVYAVIYQYEQWRETSLKSKGLGVKVIYTRSPSSKEKTHLDTLNRLEFYTYRSVDTLIEDEKKLGTWTIEMEKSLLKIVNQNQ